MQFRFLVNIVSHYSVIYINTNAFYQYIDNTNSINQIKQK